MNTKLLQKIGDREILSINDVEHERAEGRLLMAAIAKITTESQTDKTPDEVLEQLNILQKKMFIEKATP